MVLQHNYNNDIKDHKSQITITNIIILKMFQLLWKLLKSNTDTKWAWEKCTNRLAWFRVAINLQCVKKNWVSAKHHKGSAVTWDMPVLGTLSLTHDLLKSSISKYPLKLLSCVNYLSSQCLHLPYVKWEK